MTIVETQCAAYKNIKKRYNKQAGAKKEPFSKVALWMKAGV